MFPRAKCLQDSHSQLQALLMAAHVNGQTTILDHGGITTSI